MLNKSISLVNVILLVLPSVLQLYTITQLNIIQSNLVTSLNQSCFCHFFNIRLFGKLLQQTQFNNSFPNAYTGNKAG